MKIPALFVVLSLILAACAGQNPAQKIPVKSFVIPDIPQEFLDCKRPDLPDPSKLTKKQVSSLIFKYEKEINNCIGNERYIKEYIKRLKEIAK